MSGISGVSTDRVDDGIARTGIPPDYARARSRGDEM
jgi:hypothetical protein